MTKTPKQFRLSDETVARLNWLQRHTDLDATAVVTLAVSELYERHRPARLEPNGDGWWTLIVRETPVAKIDDYTIEKLGQRRPELIDRLQGDGLPASEAITFLFRIMAAGNGGEIILTDEWIKTEAEILSGSPRSA
jgi:hypothetical protein